MGGADLRHLRVLIIEDESLVTMLIEDFLADIGCTVAGIASGLEEAMDKVSSLTFDVAILDVNLNGANTYPVAEVLAKKRIPFVFSTGYGGSGLPPVFQQVPILGKPFHPNQLRQALADAMTRSAGA